MGVTKRPLDDIEIVNPPAIFGASAIPANIWVHDKRLYKIDLYLLCFVPMVYMYVSTDAFDITLHKTNRIRPVVGHSFLGKKRAMVMPRFL